jgi:hypothetical protein
VKGVVRRAKRLPGVKEPAARAGETREEIEGVVRENREAERISRLSRGKTAPFDAIAEDVKGGCRSKTARVLSNEHEHDRLDSQRIFR